MSTKSRIVGGIVMGAWFISCATEKPPEEPAAQEERSQLVQPEKWWEIQPRPAWVTLEKVGVLQGWFEVYKLPDGTYAIYEPYQFEEAISYLVLGEERGVIIDTGTGIGDIAAAVSELTDLPVSVVNTHEHYDHTGGNHGFERVAIFNHPAAIERLGKGVDNASLQRYVSDDYVWKPLPEGFDPATWTIPSVKPTTLLEDGTVIDLGGRKLEVIYTPGHSPGSICILDRENRVLFTGDHFYPGPLYAHTDDMNLDDFMASNGRIADRLADYDHVLPGHNEPWVGSEVIPRITEAFETIFRGEGDFAEDDGLRRYHFQGFDIIIHAEAVEQKQSQ
jgi:glyoxylase-like metal-dependent hydrolase (beta-lactamase superfamily II)